MSVYARYQHANQTHYGVVENGKVAERSGDPIVIPQDATREQAQAAIFGVTCRNDVSDRNWQRSEKHRVRPGDTAEITIEGVGILSNPVA
jgi:2-keto-4-pentenoate hydratase/2-oxohepta-3-ene-1,7-dioic acid hydratase in catechol pathway